MSERTDSPMTPNINSSSTVEPRRYGVASGAIPRLLILSNGHGEDAMGALLASALRTKRVAVSAFPLVGEGGAYHSAGIPIVGEQGIMPSGGFILEGSNAIWHDIQAGLLKLTWRQIQALRNMGHEYQGAVGVGDVYPLAMNALFLRRPFIFVPTAKSDYIRGHYQWEVALMRKTCRQVFPRDAVTAASLQAQNVPASYLGNLMMDALKFTGKKYGDPGRQVVGILPGSREPEAYRNTLLLLRVVERICDQIDVQPPAFVLAAAGSLVQTKLAAAAREQDWQWKAPSNDETANGVSGKLVHTTGQGTVYIVRGFFGDVLANSQVVLGMSGTGNEQAAGLGIPVVTLPGEGPQFTPHFARDQERLLGEVVQIADTPATAARLVQQLLVEPEKRLQLGLCGKERMGEPGATERMAQQIVASLLTETIV